MRSKPKHLVKTCQNKECNKEYVGWQAQKYCCPECNPNRPAREALKPIACEYCGTEFTPKRKDQRFCKTDCRHTEYARKLNATT